MRVYSSLLAVAMAVAAWPALADPAYKSADIVDFFVKSADQGLARGICVGTTDECAAQAPKPAGFDMLINFNLDSDQLTDEAQTNLGEFAKALNDERLKAAKFVVEGHTDASGSENHNEGLAERRAKSVTAFLLGHGVDASKVTAVGMGERAPRVPDVFDPINRRVEMRVNLQ